MRIRLGDSDRARYGCDEFLAFDPAALMLSEAEVLDRAGIGFDTFTGWLSLISGEIVRDEAGEPVKVNLGTEEEPDMQTLRRVQPLALRAIVWAALRRAGKDVTLEALDYDVTHLRLLPDEDSGKEPARSGSPKNVTATRSATRKRSTSRTSRRTAT